MQFDLYRNPKGGAYPYFLDLQDDLLARLPTRVVAPLMALKRVPKPVARLNPIVSVRSVEHVVLFQDLASVPVTALRERLESLAARRTEWIAALDLLFTGV